MGVSMGFFMMKPRGEQTMGYKGRDVEISLLDGGLCLVTACDSCGAIGAKPLDQLKVPPQLVGQLTARVALMEVLCTGAQPQVMTAAISSEPDPTGKGILEGIRSELEFAGFPNLPLAISTEKNFAPEQTGLGIGVTGACPQSDLRIAKSRAGDWVHCLGTPRVGKEVAQALPQEIIGTAQIQHLLAMEGVHDILPIGSRGIGAEASGLAREIGTAFRAEPQGTIDLAKAAGPSTCAIFTCKTPLTLSQMDSLALTLVGRLAE